LLKPGRSGAKGGERIAGHKGLAGNQPVEQHANAGEMLFDGRGRVFGLQPFDVGGDVDRLDLAERGDPLPFAPAQKHAGGAGVGGAGVLVADMDGEEVAEAAGGPLRGPRHSVSKGVTPVLSSEEATALLAGMNVSSVVGLHDRAIIAVMTYTFARVGAVVALNVENYYAQKKRWWLRLREKNGKLNEMPCHHKLEAYLDAYIEAASIAEERKVPLFRAAIGKTRKLGQGAMSRIDVWYMVRRRATDAGIETAIGCHTFRATGITDYLTNGGRIEVAQRMAGHSNAKTTGLYDRRNDDISVGEVERIGI